MAEIRIESIEQAVQAISGGIVRIADPEEEITNEPALATIKQGDRAVSLCSIGSLSMWVGEQKSGKSTMMAMLVASVLTDCDETVFHFERHANRVLYIDTEQPRKYSNRSIRRIFEYAKMARGYMPFKSRITYMEVKPFTVSELLLIIQAAIMLGEKEGNPFDFVVVDGIADLCVNVNDPEECDHLIHTLAAMADEHLFHCACVIHANPRGSRGEFELKARGHLGSALMRKVESVVTMEKDRETGVFTMDAPYLRDGNIEPMQFEFYDGLLHPLTGDTKVSRQQQAAYETFSGIADLEGYVYRRDVQIALQKGEKGAMNAIGAAARLGVLESATPGAHGVSRWRLITR